MRRSLAIAMAGALSVLCTTSWADPPPPIEYAYPDQSVWTTKLDDHGSPANPLLKVADALFSRAGMSWQAHPYPAARMFETLRNGSANFSMLVKSPALDQCCLVGRKPVATTELRAYHTDAIPPVQGIDGLRGRNVILIHGYSYGGLRAKLSAPDSGVTVQSAVSHQAAFTMLARSRADYVLDYAGPAREIMAEQRSLNLKHETLDRLEVYLVLSRSYPDAEATLARLEALTDKLGLNLAEAP